MAKINFTIVCPCCDDEVLMDVKNASLEAWRRNAQDQVVNRITCSDCGCAFNLADLTTSIGQLDVSQPRADSLSPSSGPRAGGTSVTVHGHALDVGSAPLVLFGGEPGVNVRGRTASLLIVDTPPCPSAFLITQGAMAHFVQGDVVVGASSGHRATVLHTGKDFVKVASPDGTFEAGEWIAKEDDEDVKVKLAASDHFDGSVDVVVANENGMRDQGAKLVFGFRYV